MSKYEPLRKFLQDAAATELPMTFAEIEEILGFPLPESQNIRAWWSNNASNNVMTKEWIAAGYKTERVDIEGRKLVFRRTTPKVSTEKRGEPAGRKEDHDDKVGKRRHPLIGAMKDVTWIAPDVDLTEPADPGWADLIDDPDWGKQPK